MRSSFSGEIYRSGIQSFSSRDHPERKSPRRTHLDFRSMESTVTPHSDALTPAPAHWRKIVHAQSSAITVKRRAHAHENAAGSTLAATVARHQSQQSAGRHRLAFVCAWHESASLAFAKGAARMKAARGVAIACSVLALSSDTKSRKASTVMACSRARR